MTGFHRLPNRPCLEATSEFAFALSLVLELACGVTQQPRQAIMFWIPILCWEPKEAGTGTVDSSRLPGAGQCCVEEVSGASTAVLHSLCVRAMP